MKQKKLKKLIRSIQTLKSLSIRSFHKPKCVSCIFRLIFHIQHTYSSHYLKRDTRQKNRESFILICQFCLLKKLKFLNLT